MIFGVAALVAIVPTVAAWLFIYTAMNGNTLSAAFWGSIVVFYAFFMFAQGYTVEMKKK